MDILENRGKLNIIEKIRDNIESNMGNYIDIIHNDGRNKIYEYSGKIVEFYNNIFIILLDDGCKKCFKYSDVLTKTIEINVKL